MLDRVDATVNGAGGTPVQPTSRLPHLMFFQPRLEEPSGEATSTSVAPGSPRHPLPLRQPDLASPRPLILAYRFPPSGHPTTLRRIRRVDPAGGVGDHRPRAGRCRRATTLGDGRRQAPAATRTLLAVPSVTPRLLPQDMTWPPHGGNGGQEGRYSTHQQYEVTPRSPGAALDIRELPLRSPQRER